MIIVYTFKQKPESPYFNQKEQVLADFGVDTDTDQMVILPQDPPCELGAVYDFDIGEYVIKD